MHRNGSESVVVYTNNDKQNRFQYFSKYKTKTKTILELASPKSRFYYYLTRLKQSFYIILTLNYKSRYSYVLINMIKKAKLKEYYKIRIETK